MTNTEYRKLRPGDRVRTLVEIQNHHTELAAGTEGTVTNKYGGVDATFDACDHCKVKPRVSRIPARKLEVIS